QGHRLAFELDAATSRRLRRLSRETGTTLFTTLLAVFGVLLRRYTEQDDLVIGTPFANRAWAETEGLLGLFINNVVLRSDLSADPNFRVLIERLRGTVLAAAEHQELPFERLVRALNVPRNRSHSPIFQVMFVFLNAPPAQLSLVDLDVEIGASEHANSEFDLSLYLRDGARGEDAPLTGWFEYATALFDESTIRRMSRHLAMLARSLAEHPDRPLSAHPLMDDDERRQVVAAWNATAAPIPEAASIQSLFEAQVRAAPERVAAICGDVALTYAELDRRADRLAGRLRARGVGPDDPIALVVERGPEMLVGMIGILKSGGAYLPVDPSYPAHRIRHMLEDSGTRVVVAQTATAGATAEQGLPILLVDDEASDDAAGAGAPPETPTRPEHLAYLIYTSGSTGVPKGVQVEHRNVLNLLTGMAREPGLGRDDRLLAVTTISFDIHVLEIFLPLSVGATLVVASRAEAGDGAKLLDLVERHRITAMQATPVTWQLMIAAGWKKRLPLRILCGGEGWPPDLAAALLARCDSLWNVYGPTETTVWSSAVRITAPDGPITIGLPMANTQFHVVGPDLTPLPVGLPGELLIGGHGVTRGYHRRPELTAERFIEDRIGGHAGRLYRTGDRARRLPDGRVVLLGRGDNQTKIRGYRIELGEIEASLIEQKAIRQAVVVVREDEPGDRRLVGYLLAAGTYRPAAAMLRTALRERLPEHMIPSQFVWLDHFPTTPNGKVDRRALPRPPVEQGETAREGDWTTTEKLVADIFAKVLGVGRVGRFDNFFDLGGHSLLSLKVVDLFEKATGRKLPPGALFQQTVAQIAAMFPEEAAPAQAPMRPPEPEKRAGGFFNLFRRSRRDG
ncbi:MAG: amino acid adenylation domain-containing protein, partial [Alphaproteobacteria bacterium]|nr:amino acid adenylation domain-containing protein [Alphaproteobacteria bacterium]